MSGYYLRPAADETIVATNATILEAASTTSLAIPSLGAIVTLTVGTGKEFTPDSEWKFSYTAGAANNFTILVIDYVSGDVRGLVIATNGSGTYASWAAEKKASSITDAVTIGTTSSSITVPSTVTNVTFTTQTGKSFSDYSLGYLRSTDGSKVIYGQFGVGGLYNSGTGAWSIQPYAVFGSGSSSSWDVVQQTPTLRKLMTSGSSRAGLQLDLANQFYIWDDTDVTNRTQFIMVPGYASSNATGLFQIVLGGSSRTLTFSGDADIKGTNTGDAGPMTTRGDILYMDSTPAVARLPIGSAGKVLKSDGTDVSWGTAGWTTDTLTLTGSVATVDWALPAGAKRAVLAFKGISCDTGSRAFRVQALTAASTPDTTAANYRGAFLLNTTGTNISVANMLGDTTTQATAATIDGTLTIEVGDVIGMFFEWYESNTPTRGCGSGHYTLPSTFYGIRLLWSGSGNFDAGSASVRYL